MNWFIIETGYVHCVVRTETLECALRGHIRSSLRKPWIKPKPRYVRFVVETVAVGIYFLFSVFPTQCHSTYAPRSSSTCCCSQKDSWMKSACPPRGNELLKIQIHWAQRRSSPTHRTLLIWRPVISCCFQKRN